MVSIGIHYMEKKMNDKELLKEINQILKSDYKSLEKIPREKFEEISMKLVINILQNIEIKGKRKWIAEEKRIKEIT